MFFFQKTFKLWDVLGVKNGKKSELMNEMGLDGFKLGIFDMDGTSKMLVLANCSQLLGGG